MPTKRNSAGQQQPYVPEGHGDASGEYAEHATGSNQHYVSPDDVKRQLGYGGEQPKQETATPKDLSDKLNGVKEQPKDKENILSSVKDKKVKENIVAWVNRYRDSSNEDILKDLRQRSYYFGDLSSFTDKQLNDTIDLIKSTQRSDEAYYIKSGSKWLITHNKELEEMKGNKVYTKEGMELEIESKHNKALEHTKSQTQDIEQLRKAGYNGVVSFKGLNDNDTKEVTNAMITTFKDFDKLKEKLVSFGTEKGVVAQVEEEYKRFTQTPEYKQKVEEFRTKLKEWNNREFTTEQAEGMFKSTWLQENTHTSKGKFWGCCGSVRNDTTKSWVQLRNTKYAKYKADNEAQILSKGYPYNIGASFGATTYHELGHAVSNFLFGGRAYFDSYADSNAIRDIENIKRKYDKPISSYGRTSTSEYIAECFASHYTDGTNQQAEEVFNYIKNKYDSMGGNL